MLSFWAMNPGPCILHAWEKKNKPRALKDFFCDPKLWLSNIFFTPDLYFKILIYI